MIPRTEIVAIDTLSSIDEVKQKFVQTKFSKLLVLKKILIILLVISIPMIYLKILKI